MENPKHLQQFSDSQLDQAIEVTKEVIDLYAEKLINLRGERFRRATSKPTHAHTEAMKEINRQNELSLTLEAERYERRMHTPTDGATPKNAFGVGEELAKWGTQWTPSPGEPGTEWRIVNGRAETRQIAQSQWYTGPKC